MNLLFSEVWTWDTEKTEQIIVGPLQYAELLLKLTPFVASLSFVCVCVCGVAVKNVRLATSARLAELTVCHATLPILVLVARSCWAYVIWIPAKDGLTSKVVLATGWGIRFCTGPCYVLWVNNDANRRRLFDSTIRKWYSEWNTVGY